MSPSRELEKISDDGKRPLKVLIAGGGIGGLTAALALRRQGHEVHVFERSTMSQETGAAIHVAPNAHGILKRLGLFPVKDLGSTEMTGVGELHPDGSMRYLYYIAPANRGAWQNSYEFVHRRRLHEGLRELALSPTGAGQPIKLHLGARIHAADSQAGSFVLDDDTTVVGDLILGADGVGSQVRKEITGGSIKPYDSGKSAFRFLIPTAKLAEKHQLQEFFGEREGFLHMWLGDDRRLVMYACDNGKTMNFVAIHPSEQTAELTKKNKDSWNNTASKSKLIELFSMFGPKVLAILEEVNEAELMIWTLLDMEVLPSFIKGRLALLGDAAHPFLPHQGQGGAQAIEDAASLAALLPRGTLPSDVSQRLKLYEQQRYTRSTQVQSFTRLVGRDLKDFAADKEPLDMNKFTAQNCGHDEEHASANALREYLARQPGVRLRAPYGFGAAPGPRQPLNENVCSDASSLSMPAKESSRRFRVRFKTSRTYLQGLLPPGFRFMSPTTFCEASLIFNELKGIRWLGRGGYRLVLFVLHGVQYTKKDGTVIPGSYIPVVWENLAESITTGREELGMPKLFSDIDLQESSQTTEITLGWRGAEFLRMRFEGLVEPSKSSTSQANGMPPFKIPTGATMPPRPPAPPAEQGQFWYRYVPAVGQPGVADAEYAVFAASPASPLVERDEKIASSAQITFSAGSWETLPTMYHVTELLSAMPVYSVLQAGHGIVDEVDDLSSATRVE